MIQEAVCHTLITPVAAGVSAHLSVAGTWIWEWNKSLIWGQRPWHVLPALRAITADVTVEVLLCCRDCCEVQFTVYYPSPCALLSLSITLIFPVWISLRVSFVVINWSALSCKKLLRVMGLPISSEWKLSVALSDFITYADTWVHGCRERGCWNEQRAAVWFRTSLLAFGCCLMGLFGMPLPLDAEWWSGKCVPFVPVPSVEVKGRSQSWYRSKIKWLEWDGRGTKSTPEQVTCQGDTSWSQGGMKSDSSRRFGRQRQWKSRVQVIFSYLLILLNATLLSNHIDSSQFTVNLV